jgi:hypothetical protein
VREVQHLFWIIKDCWKEPAFISMTPPKNSWRVRLPPKKAKIVATKSAAGRNRARQFPGASNGRKPWQNRPGHRGFRTRTCRRCESLVHETIHVLSVTTPGRSASSQLS